MDILVYMFLFLYVSIAILMYPFISVLRSNRATGIRKVVWAILVLPLSWIAFIPYLLIERKK